MIPALLMLPPALLMPPPQGGGGKSGGLGTLIFLLQFVLIFGIFYLLVLRPQSKKQNDLRKMIDSLKQGDRVMTSGGLYGTFMGAKDNVAVLKIADQVKVEVAKQSITGVIEKSREG
jgi:preprotein translocase subunit YajC